MAWRFHFPIRKYDFNDAFATVKVNFYHRVGPNAVHLDLFVCLFVCLRARNSKAIAPIDLICFTQEEVYPWLGPHQRSSV